MNEYLKKARQSNEGEIRVLITDSKQNLERLAKEMFGYTLLHHACATGHSNLAKQLQTLMPEFVEKRDKDGLSPLDVAATRGHIEIVKELLKSPKDLCSMKGPGNRIPLHYASQNGKLEVMKELLHTRPESIKETTTQKETALHLALDNDQLDAIRELVEHLISENMDEVINWKDKEGNTALHLAVTSKNYQVANFLLHQHAERRVLVDVNACNSFGKTPLDLLGREAGDGVIRSLFFENGARYSSSALQGKSKADRRDALLVIAGLILNATYQSVLQPPHFKTEIDKTYTKGFLAGYASWMTGFYGRDLAYVVFMTGNTFGFLVSVQMIISFTRDLRAKLPILLTMTFMVQTYYCHTYYLPFATLEKEFCLINVELFSVLPLTIPILLLQFQKPLAQALQSYLEEFSLFVYLRDMYRI